VKTPIRNIVSTVELSIIVLLLILSPTLSISQTTEIKGPKEQSQISQSIEHGNRPNPLLDADRLHRWRRATHLSSTDASARQGGPSIEALTGEVSRSWVANYPSSTIGSTENVAKAIAVDAQGNVYVTGYSGTSPNYDYVTLKYNALGIQQWAVTYPGPGNNDDEAVAIAVDGSGNVYVTGVSVGSGTSYDYATVKYNSAGTQQWASRYDNGGVDRAAAIAVDGSGNVYVTGVSAGSGTGDDFATVKYNSSGVQQWASRYDGSLHGNDGVAALAIDGSGNVYVAGYTHRQTDDLLTIKYNSGGGQQWATPYNGPGNEADGATAIAVDGSGNVCVTGYTQADPWDYATLKYNSSGDTVWTRRYNGPASNEDWPTGIGLDGSGNIYVTGHSYTAISSDYATVKYNSSGDTVWTRLYNGPVNDWDEATALAVDASGNAYVTGLSWSGTSDDYATVKYNSSGDTAWTARYNHSGTTEDWANAIALDTAGHVCVTGRSSSGTGSIFTTIRYAQPVLVSATVFLQGPYNAGTGLMNTTLRTSGTLATRFPGIAIPVNAVDSINIEIRNAASGSGSTVRAYAPAWVLADGSIRDFSDTTKNYVTPDAPPGNYYVVVRHRNHLAVMSSSTVSLNRSAAASWNFSTALGQAYGSGQIQIGSSPLRFGMVSGDGNQSGIVTASDANGVFGALNQTGYRIYDINLSAIVTAADANIVFGNLNRATQVP